jgi:hypothetical protein
MVEIPMNSGDRKYGTESAAFRKKILSFTVMPAHELGKLGRGDPPDCLGTYCCALSKMLIKYLGHIFIIAVSFKKQGECDSDTPS